MEGFQIKQWLNGFSGFQLNVKEIDGCYLFCKTVTNNKDTFRLFQQRDKQIKYKKIIENNPILSNRYLVPKIISSNHKSFCMEYIYGKHILDVINDCNVSILDYIIEQMFYWVEWCIEHSGSVIFTPRFFEEKIDTIPNVDNLKKIFNNLMDKIVGIRIPVGYCHGDFTLTNMLYLENGLIGLIDWHDVFFESPLQDIGKLYQELAMRWSMYMGNQYCIKFNIAYSYLLKKYNNWIDTLNIDIDVLKVFNFFTIFRLFAYTTDKGFRKIIYNKCLEVLK